MRLFIAREAVDHHFKTAFNIVNPDATRAERLDAVGRAAKFYPAWYPARWFGRGMLPSFGEFGELATHVRFAERATRHLGRSIFHAMVRYGPKLERKQAVLFRAVDIGCELFAMSAACVRARMLQQQGRPEAVKLADLFCRESRERIELLFDQLYGKHDDALYKLSQQVLRGEHSWLEQGIVGMGHLAGARTPVEEKTKTVRREAAGVG
jgi:hypothetical protein